jgi:hypothetical protein
MSTPLEGAKRERLRNILGLLAPTLILALLFIYCRQDVRPIIPYVVIVILSYFAESSALTLFIGLVVGLILYYFTTPNITLWVFWEIFEDALLNRTNIETIMAVILMGLLLGMLKFGGGFFMDYAYCKNWHSKKIELIIWFVGMITFLSQYISYLIIGLFKELVAKARKIPREVMACYANIMSVIPCPFLMVSVWGLFISSLIPNELNKNIILYIGNIATPIIVHSYFPISVAASMLSLTIVGWPSLKYYSYFDEVEYAKRLKYGDRTLIFLSTLSFLAPLTALVLLPVLFYFSKGIIIDAIMTSILVVISTLTPILFLYMIISPILEGVKNKWSLIDITSEMKKFIVDEFWNKDIIESMELNSRLILTLILIFVINTLTRHYLGLTKSLAVSLTFILQQSPSIAPILKLLFPIIFFLLSCLIGYTFGSAFLTMGVLVPLVIDILPLMYSNSVYTPYAVAIGAIISGATYGNICSRAADSIFMVHGDYLSKNNISSHVFFELLKTISSFNLLVSLFVYFLLPFFGYDGLIGIILSVSLGSLMPLVMKYKFSVPKSLNSLKEN